MASVGTSPARPDGSPKVRGVARYADDFYLPGMLYGATVRSPHPRARIEAIRGPRDTGAVFVSAADLPGANAVKLIEDDWPILASGEVRHVGEPVALVAAASKDEVKALAESVRVDYSPLAPLFDYEDPEAESISEFTLSSGSAEDVLASAARVVEGTYRCGHQEHIYIEPQTMTAWYEGDGTLTISGSMQCPYYIQKSLEHALGLDAEQIRVRANVVGGGFGGKEDYPSMIALHAALLARASGKPVRIVYDRNEDIIATTKRHPARVRHRSAVADDGTLLALDIDIVMDGGAYTTLTPVVLSRGVLHASGPYRCPHIRIKGRAVRTNTATNGAFRGFGAPQVQFAMERHMDRIARAVGLDPLTIRRLNAVRPGDKLPTGQVLDETTSAEACLERIEELTGFSKRWSANEAARRSSDAEVVRKGLGLSLYLHGAGFTGNGERRMRSPVTARLGSDGRIQVLTAMTDMGQGCVAIFPQMAAEGSGLSQDDFAFPEPDTGVVPDSGPTVASRTTMIVGGLIARVAAAMKDKVLESWQSEVGTAPVALEDGRVTLDGLPVATFREIARHCFFRHGALETTIRHETPESQQFDDDTYQGAAYPTYAWGADVVEVEVDRDTFEVRPKRATVVTEVGKAIHPTLCKGQIEGGTLQALGYGLLEEVKLDNGRYLNDRLATYIIPTFKDSPRIDVELLETDWAGGPFGAKGVGELPMNGGAPAAVGAIDNALGVMVDEIPATPERILTATRKAASEQKS